MNGGAEPILGAAGKFADEGDAFHDTLAGMISVASQWRRLAFDDFLLHACDFAGDEAREFVVFDRHEGILDAAEPLLR